MDKKIFARCPVCDQDLSVSQLICGNCSTQIDTHIPIPPFFRLPVEMQQFVMVFLRNRGNIREVEKDLGISYPTVCKKLDQVNELLDNNPSKTDKLAILEKLERNEISAQEAAMLLRGEKRK